MGTFSSGDAVTDASTTDNDTISVELVGNVDSTVTTTNIENLVLNALSGTRTVDGTKMTGVKLIESRGTGSISLTNVDSAATTYKLTGTSSDLNVSVKSSALTGAADTATVALSGTTAGTVTFNGAVETIKVTSGGVAQNVLTNVVASSATTLTVDGGAGFKNTAAMGSNFKTIDVRSAGGSDIQVTATADLAVIGGGAADKVTVTGALAATHLYSLGGGNDTLVLGTSTGGAQATFVGVENVKTTDAAATSLDFTKADQAVNVELAAAATGVTIAALKTGSTVKGTTAALGNGAVSISFAASATNTALNLDLTKGGDLGGGGSATFTNVGDLTITGGAATTLTALALDATSSDDTVATTKLTVTSNGDGLVNTGNITNGSKVTDLTVNVTGTGASATLGTLAAATDLTRLNLNATTGAITVGNIGGTTASSKLDSITVNAGKNVSLGTIAAADLSGVASVTLNATGGTISDGTVNGTITNTLTNTGADITSVTITGSKDVEIGLVTATSGKVQKVTSTNTGSTYISVTNATTSGTGTTVTLGNAATGSENVLTLATDGNHTVTGGSGTDTLSFAGSSGKIINMGSSSVYIDGSSSNTAATNIALAGRAMLNNSGAVNTSSTAQITQFSGFEKVTGTSNADIIYGSSSDDTITDAGGAANILQGAGGNDTITVTGGTTTATITGGDGNDTITLVASGTGTLTDRVILSGTGTIASGINNVDTITNFYISTTSANAAGSEDVLGFGSTWLGVGFTSASVTGSLASNATAGSADDGKIAWFSGGLAGTAFDTAAEVSAFLNANASKTDVELILIAGSDNAYVWFYDGGLDGAAAISVNDFVLIGILSGTNANNLEAHNFAGAVA